MQLDTKSNLSYFLNLSNLKFFYYLEFTSIQKDEEEKLNCCVTKRVTCIYL